MSCDWFGVIGAALRGIIPRSQDTIVSLAPVGTEESYEQYQLLRMISVWSKSIIAVLFILVCSMGLVNVSFFQDIEDQYLQAVSKPLDQKIIDKDANLKLAAEEFNNLVAQITEIQKHEKNWNEILNTIFTKATNSSIKIKRVFISAEPANNITIQGSSSAKESIVNFKDSLGSTGLFTDISLPLSGLVETSEGVTFNLSLKL